MRRKNRFLLMNWLMMTITSLFLICARAALPPVTVSNGWFRYLLSRIPAGGYMTLKNASDKTVVLTRVETPSCGMTMLNKSEDRGGVSAMLPVRRVRIGAYQSFEFAPGQYHVMCMQPHMKIGESVPVTLYFTGLPPVTAEFAVYGVAGLPSHSP